MAPNTENKPEVSEVDARLLMSLVQHANSIDVDWDAFTAANNYKNVLVAKARFGQLKKKLGILGKPAPSPKQKEQKTATPKSGKKASKRALEDYEDDEGDEEDVKSPSKKKIKVEDEHDDVPADEFEDEA